MWNKLNFEDDTANNEDEEIQTLTKLLNISSEHNICDNAIADPQSYVNMDSEIQVNDNLEGEWESRILENLQENVTQKYLSDEGEPIEHPGPKNLVSAMLYPGL
ncbi:hypothetical protein LOD99_6392 [Oopsacas minuta]|uniref:Uncharacterized protein n=1 Tax=Oopsacas minuta TaxID=111878 RepID=A0AAV7JM18_9METZ|nr:hypothetical protein LOD99_6392 [Oopsacas minuta]